MTTAIRRRRYAHIHQRARGGLLDQIVIRPGCDLDSAPPRISAYPSAAVLVIPRHGSRSTQLALQKIARQFAVQGRQSRLIRD